MHASCLQHLQPIEQRHRRNANRTAASAWLLPSAQQQWPGSYQAHSNSGLAPTKRCRQPSQAAKTCRARLQLHSLHSAAPAVIWQAMQRTRLTAAAAAATAAAAAAVAAHELHNTCCCRTADVVPGWHT